MSKTPSRPRAQTNLKAALCLGVGFTAIASAAMPAMAQEDTEDSARTLQTVTITATKREQTLQDVPIAVSVVDESVIAKAQILDLNDLQSVVPSLGVSQLQSSANTNFVIRGFGNGANNAGIEPSVGVFALCLADLRPSEHRAGRSTARTAINPVRQERICRCHLGRDQEAVIRVRRQCGRYGQQL